jgi:NAD(P)H-dependent FMN reductase
MLKVALIVGSTRPNRFADRVVDWFMEEAGQRTDMAIEIVDLRDQGLVMFDEGTPPAAAGGAYSNPAAKAWCEKIAGFDAYIVTSAEYNHGPTAVLKNALDSALIEWARKPIGFLGYGGVGAARAIEQLRQIAIELQMAPIRAEVNIAMEPYLGVLTQGKSLGDYPYLGAGRTAVLEQILWWGNALKAARETTA